jgi:hypothetical protein
MAFRLLMAIALLGIAVSARADPPETFPAYLNSKPQTTPQTGDKVPLVRGNNTKWVPPSSFGGGGVVASSNCLLISGTTTNCLLISGTSTNALLVK